MSAKMVGTSRNLLSCKQYRPIRNPTKKCFCNLVRILACARQYYWGGDKKGLTAGMKKAKDTSSTAIFTLVEASLVSRESQIFTSVKFGVVISIAICGNCQQLLWDYSQHKKLNRCLSVCRIEACVSFATWNSPSLQWRQSQLLICLKNYGKAIQKCDPTFAQRLTLP